MTKDKKRGLIERLNQGPVICAEGFLFEIEKRGYMSSGEFVPMVSLENPEALLNLHRDFQHAGSDVVQAFTYNGHREKMRVIGKEELLEPLNRAALQIAKKVAVSPMGDEQNLMAGNISNSNIWSQDNKKSQLEVEKMFREMVGWAVDEKADILIGETFYYAEEAYTAAAEGYRVGKFDLTATLDARRSLIETRAAVIDARLALQTYTLRLRALIGAAPFEGEIQ